MSNAELGTPFFQPGSVWKYGEPRLPLHIVSQIFDFCTIPALYRCARGNHSFQRLVYESDRWIKKLKDMEAWDGKKAQEELEKTEAAKQRTQLRRGSILLFDANEQSDLITPSGDLMDFSTSLVEHPGSLDLNRALGAFSEPYFRGSTARIDFASIYKTLYPIYALLLGGKDPFQMFGSEPSSKDQATILHHLNRFSNSFSQQWGWNQDFRHVVSAIETLEARFLANFESELVGKNEQGILSEYATVLYNLTGGESSRTVYTSHQLGFLNDFKNVEDCFHANEMTMQPLYEFFVNLDNFLESKSAEAVQVFPRDQNIMSYLLSQVIENVVAEYITAVFAKACTLPAEVYLKAVAISFERCYALLDNVSRGEGFSGREKVSSSISLIFESYTNTYFDDEMDLFQLRCTSCITNWKRKISKEIIETESAIQSNKDLHKKDFLASFKKFMRIDNSSPSNTTSSKFQSDAAQAQSPDFNRETALMNARLEGIKTLCSFEVALDLIHLAKGCMERARLFTISENELRFRAGKLCENIFICMLDNLGPKHIKLGFEQAMKHLGDYKPTIIDDCTSVKPLITFLELVNVGDLILQMVVVFYEQELVFTESINPSDFLNAAVKAKKRFEQMLDDCLAEGLNKGINALIYQIELILKNAQKESDYNPSSTLHAAPEAAHDFGPSSAALTTVQCVSSHLELLIGSIDQEVLDVFFLEVGMRVFSSLCKHIRRYHISTEGALRLISDLNCYYAFAATLKQSQLLPYFAALKEVGNIFLVDGSQAKEIGQLVGEAARFGGVFQPEEVYAFVERRADWPLVQREVDKTMYGIGSDCTIG